LLLSLILVYIFTNKVSLIIKVSILIITLLSYFLITLLFFSQESVLEQVTFVTRITVIISSVFSLFTHPLGVTPFGFLSSFYDNINYVVSYLDSFDFILNTSEVKRYINADSDNEIGTKSFFFNFIYYFGWPFLALFFYKLIKAIRICREHKRQDLELAIWFVSISLFSFVEGVGLYPISILLFIIINELKKIQKID
jgi:uncharacterized phage infection (PIP) family protein YhgE